MGKRCMPCNLSPEEQKAAWEEFGESLTRGEEEEIMEEVLPNYLFYQVEGRKRRRCVCTHLECGVFEIDRDENREFYGLKHGDITKCPVCGGRVMLQAVGRLRTFRSLNDRKWKQITVCRTGKNGALLLMSGFVSRFFICGRCRRSSGRREPICCRGNGCNGSAVKSTDAAAAGNING